MSALERLDLDLDLVELEHAVRPTFRDRMVWFGQSMGDRVRANALDLTIVTLLVTIAVVAHMRGMYDTPARFDDEGTYTAYAWAVEYEHRLGHYTYWYAHPPLGWIQMAFWNWITDAFNRAPYAVAAVRQMMVLAKAVSVVLMYVLALRLRMTRVGATAAVLMFSLSPLALYFTRTALLDNLVTPWLLGAFVLAASRRRGMGTAAASAACFAVAVLSKETALLFLPALVVLFWQCSDRRNRKFTSTFFGITLVLLLLLYPAYAFVKNELFEGAGHVSLVWAIKWQLFDRQGSGSIFNPHSTAHAVASSWMQQDPWFTRIALVLVVPALFIRATRAIAIAFGIQLLELLRSGYLPYPFVVAMIPFGALTIAGVIDAIWRGCRVPLPQQWQQWRAARWLTADRPSARNTLMPRCSRLRKLIRLDTRAKQPSTRVRLARVIVRLGVVVSIIAFLVSIARPLTADIKSMWYDDRDRGAAAALDWVRSNVPQSDRIVVDDAFWVDLVRHGYQQPRTIWFTKLDVDPSVKLPTHPGWKSINYVVLTFEDEMSLHMTLDDAASPSTRADFPTLGAALSHAQIVGRFGASEDRVVIWRVLTGASGAAS